MLAVDTETNGEDIRDGRGYCTGISIAAKIDGKIIGYYFPFRHTTGGNLPAEALFEIRDLLESNQPKVFHNAKFDLVSLSTLDINIPVSCPIYCTMLISHIINENRPFSYSLNSCAAWYLGDEANNQKEASEDFKKYIKQFGWANIPVKIMFPYAVQDAKLTFRLLEKIWPLFKQEKLAEYWKHKVEFMRVIIAMESRGVNIDEDLCKQQAEFGDNRMVEIIKELGGYSPGRQADLHYLLIEKMKLPIYKTSEKTDKPSFDKEAMALYDEDMVRLDSPIAKLVIEYRGWQKSVSSNYRPYVELRSPDGALRCNYKLHGTKTGRMSCEKPNLQQIPRVSSKPWNGKLKSSFVARKGYTMWEADYSQLELRLSTAYGQVKSLIQVFEEGRDIFTEMSGPLQLVRQDTKTWVYLTQYGGGVKIACRKLSITESKARTIKENYFETYPEFKVIADKAQGMALNHGKVGLWSGRYRHFMYPEKEGYKALNSIIQGGAADIVEKVMVRLYNEVDRASNDECHMLLQVHDSVVFEIKKGKEEHYKRLIHKIMEDVDGIASESFGVRFNVEIKPWGND